MTAPYMFCYNPKCRFHMEISEATAALGEIQYSAMEEAGRTDIFDQPSEINREYPTTIKRRYFDTKKRRIFLCEDCWNAFAFSTRCFVEDQDG